MARPPIGLNGLPSSNVTRLPPTVIVLYLASAPPPSRVDLSFLPFAGARIGVLGAGSGSVLSIMTTYKVEARPVKAVYKTPYPLRP